MNLKLQKRDDGRVYLPLLNVFLDSGIAGPRHRSARSSMTLRCRDQEELVSDQYVKNRCAGEREIWKFLDAPAQADRLKLKDLSQVITGNRLNDASANEP